MATRPAPLPRPKFRTETGQRWIRMEREADMKELKNLKDMEKRGLIRFTYQTVPPIVTSEGQGRIYLEYEMDIQMTPAEILEAQRAELDELNQQLRTESYQGRIQDSRIIHEAGLTDEEIELLKKYQEPQPDEE